MSKYQSNNMKNFVLKTKYADTMVYLDFHIYTNGTPAIRALSALNGDLVMTLTVAIEGVIPDEGCVLLKDWSENEGVVGCLVKEGIVELTGRQFSTGYVFAKEAKLLMFDENFR